MKKNPLLFIYGIFAVLGIVFIVIGIVTSNFAGIKQENRVKKLLRVAFGEVGSDWRSGWIGEGRGGERGGATDQPARTQCRRS